MYNRGDMLFAIVVSLGIGMYIGYDKAREKIFETVTDELLTRYIKKES